MPAVYFLTQLLPFSCVSVFQLCILKLYQGVKFSAELASVIGGMPVVVTNSARDHGLHLIRLSTSTISIDSQ